jgi:hypothetical protein
MFTLLLLGFSPVACARGDTIPAAPTAELAAAGITARIDNGGVEIRNGSSERVYIATLERRYFETAFAIWCMGHPQCGVALDPGTTRRVELARISGYDTSSSEVIVFWWPDRPPPSGDEPPPPVTQIIVSIR